MAGLINIGVFLAFMLLFIKGQPGRAEPMLVASRDLLMLRFFLGPALLLFTGAVIVACYSGS